MLQGKPQDASSRCLSQRHFVLFKGTKSLRATSLREALRGEDHLCLNLQLPTRPLKKFKNIFQRLETDRVDPEEEDIQAGPKTLVLLIRTHQRLPETTRPECQHNHHRKSRGN